MEKTFSTKENSEKTDVSLRRKHVCVPSLHLQHYYEPNKKFKLIRALLTRE